MRSKLFFRAFRSSSSSLLLAASALAMTSCTTEAAPPAEAGLMTFSDLSQTGTVEPGGDDEISPTANDTFHNWFTGLPRGPEHGLAGPSHGDCPLGAAVVGVQYFEGGSADWVDNIGVACWGPTTGYRFTNWYSGGTRAAEQGTHGSSFGLCPWGQVVSGLQYFGGGVHGDGVDGVGVRCSSVDFTATFYSNWFPNQPGNEQGDFNPHFSGCPNNTVVVGVQAFEGIGGQPDWMDAIGVHCASLPW